MQNSKLKIKQNMKIDLFNDTQKLAAIWVISVKYKQPVIRRFVNFGNCMMSNIILPFSQKNSYPPLMPILILLFLPLSKE